MNNRRDKPGAGFWLTIVLSAIVVMYPLSWGPWCSCCTAMQHLCPAGSQEELFARATARGFYVPVIYVVKRMPVAIGKGYQGYIRWWHAEGVKLTNYLKSPA
jgi:hypothetical protein